MDCTVCKHLHRVVIDRLLSKGGEVATLSRQFALDEHALRNHRQSHIQQLSLIAQTSPASALEKWAILYNHADKIREWAMKDEEKPKAGIALIAIKEQSVMLEKMSRFAMQFKGREAVPDLEAIKAMLVATLEPHPEIQAKVVDALDKIEFEGAA